MSEPTIQPQFPEPAAGVDSESYQLRAPGFRAAPSAHEESATVPPAPSLEVPAAPALPASEQPIAPGAVASAQPDTERVVRGILLSLAVLPVGVIAWVALWNAGFIASIVSFGVAFGAVWLYRLGSGGARVTRGAFWALIAVIVVTVGISFLAGIYSDLVAQVAITWNQALTTPGFWATFWDNIFNNPALWGVYGPQLLLALLFAALGCYGTIRRLARESRA